MRYSLVPFQVGPGHRQLHIRYSYSDQIDSDPLLSGGNTLDIGLFDPRGTETGSVGFRGWSGSNKLEFVVGEDWATPPYAPGPILPGTWNVLLGPYKVGPRGCDWSVEIRFDPELPPFERDVVRMGTRGGRRCRRRARAGSAATSTATPATPTATRGQARCSTPGPRRASTSSA